MKKLARWARRNTPKALLGAAIIAAPVAANAQIDYGAGTNAVGFFVATANTSFNISQPVVLGLVGFTVGLGMLFWAKRRAKIGG